MAELSDYEKKRLENIAANMAVLESLGLGGGVVPQKRQQPLEKKKKVKATATSNNKRQQQSADADVDLGPRRKSARFSGEFTTTTNNNDDDASIRQQLTQKHFEKPPDIFGAIEGFPVGSSWDTRAACCADLVHRATVAGIVGNAEAGCYSIVLNGGYADDVDEGEYLTYTGSGGRSLKGTAANPKNLRTGPATHDQTLEGNEGRFNAALHR